MSKKFLPILIVAILIFIAVLLAMPKDATASQSLGIITPSAPPTTEPPPPTTEPPPPTTEPPPPTTEPPPPTTEPPPPTTEPPPPATERPSKPKEPKETELVLLPATGEFPIDPSQGMQWFFALTMIFLIGFILIRTLRGAKIKK